MSIWIAIRKGVYRHEIGGVFSTEELARDAAAKLLEQECDGYHDYEILPLELDVAAKFNAQFGYPIEPECIEIYNPKPKRHY